ncbi:OLC1v1002899C1 [Oldenlandia corymbosa var. corymbosa]|uniref:OLC1v1002899C1 n=1 Tax=Oldenlandia corymbosa var. corymbosa TaxID=529605 RepID=A0AAV1DC71_OLDCO|nr:OLC1v1002899C1 [Oldenlandia corymbosa var. corymbosa]
MRRLCCYRFGLCDSGGKLLQSTRRSVNSPTPVTRIKRQPSNCCGRVAFRLRLCSEGSDLLMGRREKRCRIFHLTGTYRRVPYRGIRSIISKKNSRFLFATIKEPNPESPILRRY